MQDDLEAFLAHRVAASGPTVRPVWFLWEDKAFWWLTGSWSALARRLQQDPAVALVVDTPTDQAALDQATGALADLLDSWLRYIGFALTTQAGELYLNVIRTDFRPTSGQPL